MTSPTDQHPHLEQDRRHFDEAALPSAELDALFASLAEKTVDRVPGLGDRIREASMPTRLAFVLGSLTALAAVLMALQGVRPDLNAGMAVALGPGFLVLALAATGSVFVALRGFETAISTTARRGALAAGLLVPLAVAAVPGWWPGMNLPPEAGWGPAVHCFTWGAIGAVLTMMVVLVAQRADRPAPWRIASAAGVGGGVGFIVQTLTCPAHDLSHLLFSHGAMGIVVAACALAISASVSVAER